MSQTTDGQIDTVMQEERVFPPGEAFSSRARISSMEAYEKALGEGTTMILSPDSEFFRFFGAGKPE